MNCFDPLERNELMSTLERRQYDLLVIGGGITGAGILHHATEAGYSTALLEADDFASGTSSKSTKLIHGGLRYLAMGQVKLVTETARQRQEVNLLAPHLAQAAWLMLPAKNRLELWKYRLGVSLYELLGRVSSDLRHYLLDTPELSTSEPLLNTQEHPFACVYTEYLTDDARLVLANLRSGVIAGGVAASRLKVVDFVVENGVIAGVRAECQITGDSILVRSKCVINASGPWSESLSLLAGDPNPEPLVLSKGIHIVVPHERLPIREMTLLTAKDKRPVFAIPRGKVVYLGTTDTFYKKTADSWPKVEKDEVLYLLETANSYFHPQLSFDDVLTTWAGLRPLIFQSGKTTREISRRDEIWVGRLGLITIAGGKLTGYGHMAEEVVATAVRVADLPKRQSPSEHKPLPGGDIATDIPTYASSLQKRFGLGRASALRLVRLYGSEAEEVWQLGSEAVTDGGSLLKGEIYWAMRFEAAMTLEDLLYRRTRIAVFCPDEMEAVVHPTANLMATYLGWSDSQKAQEIEKIVRRMSQDMEFYSH